MLENFENRLKNALHILESFLELCAKKKIVKPELTQKDKTGHPSLATLFSEP